MASIRIKRFGGINNSVQSRNADPDIAQVAHNCLLWDGALRPLAKWLNVAGGFTNRYTLMFDNINGLHTINLENAFYLKDLTYQPGMLLGLNPSVVNSQQSNICYQNNGVNIDSILEVGVSPPVALSATTFTWSRQYFSNKPVNRLYAVSFVKNNAGKLEESPLVMLPNQSASAQYYEGDSCTMAIRVQSANIRENCYLRLYRSISGLDTGQAVTNPLDTQWVLVAELQAYVAYNAGVGREYDFVDSGSVTTDDLDVYVAGRFYPPLPLTYGWLDHTEGGWIVAAASTGDVAISERHMTHAYPTENYIRIPATITDMVVHYDTAYIGTNGKPYAIAINQGDSQAAVQLNTTYFPESYACLIGSMTESAAGVIYASAAGLVSLTQTEMRVLTSDLTQSNKPLYHAEYLDTTNNNALACVDVDFQDTVYGTYWRGIYWGFCNVPINGDLFLPVGYQFDTGSSLDGSRPWLRLATFDYPTPGVMSSTMSNNGLAILTNGNQIWEMALPNMSNKEAYNNAVKMTYSWKSKKFVMPGLTTFGAAKIIHDCGCLRFRMYVDGRCTYDTPVSTRAPFTLPPSVVGVEFEFELEGTANVYELHVATDVKDLIEA